MSLDLRLTPRLGLQQRATPQLLLLTRLLACQDLGAEIAEALTDYPALEEMPDDTVDGAAGGVAEDLRLLQYLHGGIGRDPVRISLEVEAEQEDRVRETAAPRSTGLAEHLLAQLSDEFDRPTSRLIGEWIIGNLDRNGYLREDVSEIARCLAAEPEEVATVLARIQLFDPIGAATRDARECLVVQARAHFPDRPHLLMLIERFLPALERRAYPAIAHALGISVGQVLEEEQRLIALTPRPARGFGDQTPEYITPDVYIHKMGGDFLVRVNDDGLPRLRLSPYYRRILENPDGVGPEDLAFVRAKIAAAKDFIDSVYTRQRTIRRVAEAIVHRQRDFLERGIQYLRPMTLRNIAGDIGMSESTVSRATSRKYADTPQGVLELKYLFAIGLQTADGAEATPESVKDILRRIVGLENPAEPLSDQRIVRRLRDDHGILIARRTLAKYREALGIASACRRRSRLARSDAT